MSRRLAFGAACVAAAASILSAPTVEAERAPSSYVERLLADVRARVDAVLVARRPVPPTPVTLAWKLVKLGSFDLGAPLATLAAGDLDGDGKGELYAVTAREVIAIGLGDRKPKELGRVAFGGERSARQPRDIVGTATVDGATLVASVSPWARSLRVTWQRGTLVATTGDPGFLLCPGEVAMLVPGRNYFGDAQVGHYGARCTSKLVDREGYPLRVRSQLSLASMLDITVETCAAGAPSCQPVARHEHAGVGVAFEVADLDRDGGLEVIASGAGAPGEPDTLRVVPLGGDERKPRFKKAFTAGGVAGIAVTDLDGNGVIDAVAAVRLVGATRVDLWRLE